MTEVKVVGRRRTQFLDDLRNKRRYWELNKEAKDLKKMDNNWPSRINEEKEKKEKKKKDFLRQNDPNSYIKTIKI